MTPPWMEAMPSIAPRPQTQRIACIEPPPPALAIAGRCFIARGSPGAVEALRSAGESVVEVELDEFLRADGGPTRLVASVP